MLVCNCLQSEPSQMLFIPGAERPGHPVHAHFPSKAPQPPFPWDPLTNPRRAPSGGAAAAGPGTSEAAAGGDGE